MKTFKEHDFGLVGKIVQEMIEHLSQSHQHFMQTTVFVEAQSFANKNLPYPEEQSIEPYLTTINGAYTGLKKEVELKLSGRLQKFFATVNAAHLDERIRQAQDEDKKETDNIKNFETDKSRLMRPGSHEGYKNQQWVLKGLAFADCGFMVSSFLRFSDIFLLALFIGFAIGMAQIHAAKTAALTIREIAEPQRRKLYYGIAITAAVIISLLLGLLRYYFVHQGADASIPFIFLNPFSFAALNLLLVIATALLVHFYFPTKAEMKVIDQVDAIDKQIEKCLHRKVYWKKMEDQAAAQKLQTIKMHGQIVHDQKKLFERIDAYYDVAVGSFKNENITKRTDGKIPACFKTIHRNLPGLDTDSNTMTAK